MAPEHGLLFITIENKQPGRWGPAAMQLAQGWMGHSCSVVTATNQKPGAEIRPGSILQFQFPE
jgi:hypothetical protein